MTDPTFFKSAAAWRKWLEKSHDKADELLVGFHKVSSGNGGITYKEALDEALCFGWIDGVRRGGELTWTIRFTRRSTRNDTAIAMARYVLPVPAGPTPKTMSWSRIAWM